MTYIATDEELARKVHDAARQFEAAASLAEARGLEVDVEPMRLGRISGGRSVLLNATVKKRL